MLKLLKYIEIQINRGCSVHWKILEFTEILNVGQDRIRTNKNSGNLNSNE